MEKVELENTNTEKKKTWATVDIDLNKLIDACSNGRKTKEEIIKDLEAINDKNVHKVFHYRKLNEGFVGKVTFYNDGTKVIGDIRPSYRWFLGKIFAALNVNPNLKYLIDRDDQDFEDVLKARISKLLLLADEANLSLEFPVLYDDLQNGRKIRNDIERRRKELDRNTTISPEERMKASEKLDQEGKYLHRRAITPAFFSKTEKYSFIHMQKKLFTIFVEKRKEYKKLTKQDEEYGKYIAENFDIDKIALYVVYGYLNVIDYLKDRETQLKYYKLVELYLNNPAFKKDVEIFVDGIDINYDLICNRAEAAAKKLNRVDIKVEWELLPVGSGFRTILDADKNKKSIKTPEDELEIIKRRERNLEVGRKQTEFFMNTNYIAKAMGLKTFAGYFAYIYPNGIVVLEKDFREAYPSTAEGAIYVMDAKNFELLSGMGKTDLIYHPLLLKHIPHKENYWPKAVKKFIDKEGTKEEQEEAKQLIKRMQK